MNYSRHELCENIGKEGLKILGNSTIAVIGLGAIGSNTVNILVRAGIGNLILIDRDIVEDSNLNSQNLYTLNDIETPKALAAKNHLEKINDKISIEYHSIDLNQSNIRILDKVDLILDCTDNMSTRYLINDYCIKNNKDWIYSAAVKDKGFVMPVITSRYCFECIFKDSKSNETCETSGILNYLASIVSSIQCNETIKLLLKESKKFNLIKIDAWNNSIEKLNIKRRNDCNACNKVFKHLNSEPKIIKFCGSGNYQISTRNIDLKELKSRLSKIDNIKDLSSALHFKNMFIFKDRVLIKSNSEKEAKSLVSKYIGD